jgi:methylphosphotriester-DNA--protein-cysteine methyltransferase
MTKTYRLLGADGRFYQSATKGLFGGTRVRKLYGRLDCPAALRALERRKTYPRDRVFFADQATAVAAGFRPCAVCMREAYNKWKAERPAARNP